MNRIEFLGAPGVGKSTLCKRLISDKDISHKIHSEMTGCIEAFANKRRKGESLTKTERLFVIMSRLPISMNLNTMVFKSVLKNSYDFLPWETESEISALDQWLGLNSNSNYYPLTKALRVMWLIESAKRVRFMMKYLSDDTLVVIDEGIVQSILALWSNNQAEKMVKLAPIFLKLRCIIFLDSDLNTVTERIKNRNNNFTYRQENEDIKTSILNRMTAARQLSDYLENRGIQIVRLNTNESTIVQMDKIKNVIMTI